MSIRLKWMNRNPKFDSVTIYRDTKFIDLAALPPPLVVLTNKETEYLDTTAPRGTLLWYAFAIKEGTEVVYSRSKPMVNTDYNGPGPQTIFSGDWNQGYFGKITSTELFTQAEACAPFNITATSGTLNWYKFAYRGKVLYIPDVVLSNNVGWNLLYTKGLVFGVDGDGPTGHSNPVTNQFKTLSRGTDQFLVRLPRLSVSPSYPLATDVDSEYYSCVYAMAMYSKLGTATSPPNVPLNNMTNAGLTSPASPCPMAEFQTGALNTGCAHAVTNGYTVNTGTPGNCVRSTSTYGWRPVLEYIYP